jgi:protein-disulfide isomerase
MSSASQKGKPQPPRPAARAPKSPAKEQPKRQPPKATSISRPAPANIPWYFWAGLAVLVVGGVVLIGTLLSANPSTPPASPAVAQSTALPSPHAQVSYTPSANVTPDARSLLTNGYGEGNPNAAVKVVEYGDFQCPSCETFFTSAYSQVKQLYVDSGKIYYYYKPFPLTNIHPKAMKAADLATCAADSGTDKFFAIHDLLYAHQNDWVNGDENTFFAQYATQVGLDASKVMACVNGGSHEDIMNANIDEGIALKVPGTPEFYVNGQKLDGATLDGIKQAIDAELSKVGK